MTYLSCARETPRGTSAGRWRGGGETAGLDKVKEKELEMRREEKENEKKKQLKKPVGTGLGCRRALRRLKMGRDLQVHFGPGLESCVDCCTKRGSLRSSIARRNRPALIHSAE